MGVGGILKKKKESKDDTNMISSTTVKGHKQNG